jgi:hypothetical protein
MEKIIIVTAQGALQEHKYDNGQKSFKKVEVECTDGKDSFICEAVDDLADTISKEPLSKGHVYAVDVKLAVRTSKDREGKERRFNSLRLASIYRLS